jgi:hypothetical protein
VISAKEAKRLTNEQIENNHTKELMTLESLIDTAISEGDFSINIGEHISNSSVQALEQFGYKVELLRYRNERCTNISWEDA